MISSRGLTAWWRTEIMVSRDMTCAQQVRCDQNTGRCWVNEPTALTFSCWLPTQFHLQRLVSCVRWDVLESRCPQVVFNPSSPHNCACPQSKTRDLLLNMACCSLFRSLGNAFQQEAILEIRQVLDEHNKRKRPVWNWFFIFLYLSVPRFQP